MLVKFISCTSYQPLFIQDTKYDLEQTLQVSEVSWGTVYFERMRKESGGGGCHCPVSFEGPMKSIFNINPQFPPLHAWESEKVELQF